MMDGAPPLQFVVTPEETLIFNTYRDLRHIYTDGRAHPPEEDRWPTTWGDSVGRWEGDTLVIDTVSVREPNKYFGISVWLSDGAHYTERLRMTSPDRIEGVRGQVAVERRAKVELAPGSRVTLEARPAVAAVARREIRPAAREDVGVDVDRPRHAPSARPRSRSSSLTSPHVS